MELTPHDIVRSDLAGWRRERLPDPAERRPIRVTPDWVCEITSQSSQARDRVVKRNLYARRGIPFYWIVDPATRTLEALGLQNPRWVELGAWDDTATARIAPFEEIELEIGRSFLPEPTSAG